MKKTSDKITNAIIVLAIIWVICVPGMKLIFYLTADIKSLFGSDVKNEISRYDKNDFGSLTFEDITPGPLCRGNAAIGSHGPFFLMVKIDRGEGPVDESNINKDPRYSDDREKIQFVITQGTGVIRPFSENKSFWDDYTLFDKKYTFTTDVHGQVIVAFYPSMFSYGGDCSVNATVLDNPKVTGSVGFYWQPCQLRETDFHDAIEKFVEWHNQVRLINRTEEMKDVTDYGVPQLVWPGINAPPHNPAPDLLKIQDGNDEYEGNVTPIENLTYDSFVKETGRVPWGITEDNVILISKVNGRFFLWFYDRKDGVLKERITIPSEFGFGCSDSQMGYEAINGTLFQSSQTSSICSGQMTANNAQFKLTVTLAQ
jgi:hypothetical protein